MTISLEVRRAPDLKAYFFRRRIYLYRIWGQVEFREPRGWSQTHLAIVDTGAPYSVIPAFLWKTLAMEPLFKTPLQGIAPGRRATVDALLARVSGRIRDTKNRTRAFPIYAMLATSDHVPLILGWSGLLDRSKLVVDAPRNKAWLEF